MRNLSILLCLFLILIFAPALKEKCTNAQCSLKTIEHSITYSQKGTRSEAMHGHLSINGKEIPDKFKTIRCGNTVYKFYQRKNVWGRDGYFPDTENISNPIKTSKKQISGEYLARGWYIGRKLLKGTPADWLLFEWEGGSAFASPDAIDKMATSLNLKTIPRGDGLKVRIYNN